MCEPDVLTTLGSSCDRSSRGRVPPKLGEPVGQGFPGMIRDWVGQVKIRQMDNSVLEEGGANVNRMMDDCVTAWAKIRVLTRPRIVGVGAPNMDKRGILVPVGILGLFWVAQEGEGVLVSMVS